MVNNNRFILLDKEKSFLVYLEKYILPNIAKTHKTIRQRTSEEIYDLITNTHRVSVNVGNIRNKYLNDTKVNIMNLDFYLGVMYAKEIIIKKRFLSAINMLSEINKIVYSLDYKEEKK